ncbi:MAG: TPM domain-containing protein, partial [Dongiales bacterium]
ADRYHVVSLAGGILAALAAALVVRLVDPWGPPLLLLLGAQIVAFGIVYGILELTPLSVRLAPRRARQVKARRLAHLLFLDRGLASLPEHNGVLLLVALAEHQVEIVADHGIESLAGSAEWKKIVDAFTATARQGAVAKALETAIRDLGALLARHYPVAPGDRNHLPDRLIEL